MQLQISSAQFIAIVSGIIVGWSALAFFLMRALLITKEKQMKETVSNRIDATIKNFDYFKESITDQFRAFKETISKDIVQLEKDISSLDATCSDSIKGFEAIIEKFRDRQGEFLKEYHIVDSTRGNKVDALFTKLDEMRKYVKELKPILHNKAEEIGETLRKEMQFYLRDLVREDSSRKKG